MITSQAQGNKYGKPRSGFSTWKAAGTNACIRFRLFFHVLKNATGISVLIPEVFGDHRQRDGAQWNRAEYGGMQMKNDCYGHFIYGIIDKNARAIYSGYLLDENT